MLSFTIALHGHPEISDDSTRSAIRSSLSVLIQAAEQPRSLLGAVTPPLASATLFHLLLSRNDPIASNWWTQESQLLPYAGRAYSARSERLH